MPAIPSYIRRTGHKGDIRKPACQTMRNMLEGLLEAKAERYERRPTAPADTSAD